MPSPASTSPTGASAESSSRSTVGALFFLADLREAELSSSARKDLPASAFVYPDEERYPIHDEAHGRNAIERVEANGDAAEKAKVKAAVYEKYPSLKPSAKKTQESDQGLAARIQAAGGVRLRESAFPLFAGYDLASLLRGAGTVWADAQATGSTEDEADAATIAKTVKRVIARHPEIVQLGGDSCGCGAVCCC